MVFVSMTSDELLARTAQYQLQYPSHRRRRRNRRYGLQPSQEYLTAFRSPLQSLDRTVPMGPASHATSDNENAANDPQAEFRITTDYDEYPEDNSFMEREDDNGPSVAELERVQEDDDFCSESEESISEDEDLDDSNTGNVHRRRIELQRLQSMQRRRPASLVNPIPPPSSAPAGSTGASSNVEVLKPHARFFIEREKSMVSIKFDPPPYVGLCIRQLDIISLTPVTVLDGSFSSSFGALGVMAISIFRALLPMDMRGQDSSQVVVSDKAIGIWWWWQ
jgi:hypothetical protein